MTAAIAVILALVAGHTLGAALGALTLTQAIQLGAFGVEAGVQGIKVGANIIQHLPPPRKGKALKGHPEARLCLHGAPSAQAWSICHETH
jgi:hypothetical protein